MDKIDELVSLLPWMLLAFGALIAVARVAGTRTEIRTLTKNLDRDGGGWSGSIQGTPYIIRPTVLRPGLALSLRSPFPGHLVLERREGSWLGSPSAKEGCTGDIRFDGRFRITGADRSRAAELLRSTQLHAQITRLFSLSVERLSLGPQGLSAWVPASQFRQLGTSSIREALELLSKMDAPKGAVSRASTHSSPPATAWPRVSTKAKPGSVVLKVAKQVPGSGPDVSASRPPKVPAPDARTQAAKHVELRQEARKRVFPVRRVLLLLGVFGLIMFTAGLQLYRPLDPDLYFALRGADFISDIIGFGAGIAIVFTLPALVWRKGKIFRVLSTALLAVIALPLFAGGLFALLNGLNAAPLDHHQITTVLGKQIEDPEAPTNPDSRHDGGTPKPVVAEVLEVLTQMSRPILAGEDQPLRIVRLSSPIDGRGFFTLYCTEAEFRSTEIGGKLRLVTRRGWLAGDIVVAVERM